MSVMDAAERVFLAVNANNKTRKCPQGESQKLPAEGNSNRSGPEDTPDQTNDVVRGLVVPSQSPPVSDASDSSDYSDTDTVQGQSPVSSVSLGSLLTDDDHWSRVDASASATGALAAYTEELENTGTNEQGPTGPQIGSAGSRDKSDRPRDPSDGQLTEVIERRLFEVKDMISAMKPTMEDQSLSKKMFHPDKAKNTRRSTGSLASLCKERQAAAAARVIKSRSKSVHARECLRHSTKIALLIRNGFTGRKKYFVEDNFDDPSPQKFRDVETTDLNDIHGHSSIGWETQLCLRTMPHFRTPQQIQRITWLLRATKAFYQLFSPEMEAEVARYVAYEIYDEGRLLSYQNRVPERLYYIIAGKIKFVKTIELAAGDVTKEIGVMNKGETSNVVEFEEQTPRESMMVSRGQLEVLILYIEDFFYLKRTSTGPPVEWIRSLDLFQEFPCEKMENSPEVADFKFFPNNEILTDDSNRTPWLYIVKTGTVRVVRNQRVVDVSNEHTFDHQNTVELGCGKSYSHATSMLGLLAHQKPMKTLSHIVLPQINRKQTSRKSKLSNYEVRTPTVDVQTYTRLAESTNIGLETTSISQTPATVAASPDTPPPSVSSSTLGGSHANSAKRSPRTLLPPIGIPMRTDELDETTRLFLTREKTKMSSAAGDYFGLVSKEIPNRMAFVQLDMLKPQDIFGIDHLQKAKYSEDKGLTLISCGAEVVRVSKRFFLLNAANNAMLKVETMFKHYMTVDEVKSILQTKETWDKYKILLFQQTVASVKSSTKYSL